MGTWHPGERTRLYFGVSRCQRCTFSAGCYDVQWSTTYNAINNSVYLLFTSWEQCATAVSFFFFLCTLHNATLIRQWCERTSAGGGQTPPMWVINYFSVFNNPHITAVFGVKEPYEGFELFSQGFQYFTHLLPSLCMYKQMRHHDWLRGDH